MVETLETAHTWSRLGELHAAVAGAIRDSLAAQGTPGLAFCHLSHAYADGASLYFTFISRARRGEEIEQWQAVKRAASEAIVANRRHDHPPSRRRPRPRPLHGGRGGGDGGRRAAGGQGATRSDGNNESGKVDTGPIPVGVPLNFFRRHVAAVRVPRRGKSTRRSTPTGMGPQRPSVLPALAIGPVILPVSTVSPV